MRIRKEVAFFAGVAALLGLLARGDLTAPTTRRGGSSKSAKPLEPNRSPVVADALPDGKARGGFRRDLFTPPSDTLPLPPLELELPPYEPLVALAPPWAFGPGMDQAHRLLRRDPVARPDPELFVEFEPSEDAESDADETKAAPLPEQVLDRGELIETYKKLYDWMRIPGLVFGHIRNADRYGLAERPQEPIQWVEVDPATGALRFGGQTVPIERSRVNELGFADTPGNRLELARRALGGPLRPTQLEAALRLGEECLAQRNEVPRALAMAEEVYLLAAEVAEGDPRPRLGLARCLELGFRFEEAFELYQRLTEEISAQEVVLVHARFADLLARFRLFDLAEEHYALALKRSSQNWEARWRMGRFLLERGRGAEALSHLQIAHDREPQVPEAKAERSAVRTALAEAQLEAGQVSAARASFERALGNDPDDPTALGGLFVASMLEKKALPAEREALLVAALDHGLPGADFEALLALGLVGIERGRYAEALNHLRRAAEADPFRAGQAWRMRSWLAELTDNRDEALRSIQQAYENDPTDPWTLYQRGRLLLASDDLEGARASFEAALERQVDFVDVLVELGALAQYEGRHEDAESYYERALTLDPDQPRVLARRGFNHLERGEVDLARAAFERARAGGSPTASLGLAWCAYSAGEVVESTTLLSELSDSRRNLGADDPWRNWADAQIQRILDHHSKEVWLDRFDRRPGNPANGWMVELGTGLEIGLVDGAVQFAGQITSSGRARFWRLIASADFVNWQAQVRVDSGTAARVGVFVALERQGGPGESVERASAMLSRNKDGAVQQRFVQSGNREAEHQDVPGASWPVDRPVAIRMERSGEGNESQISIYMDGIPVVQGVRVSALGTGTSELRFGVFVEGDPGRRALVQVDDVEVVRRTKR